jgi:hypothetical protein
MKIAKIAVLIVASAGLALTLAGSVQAKGKNPAAGGASAMGEQQGKHKGQANDAKADHSNKGGAVRGDTRADAVAGAHGDAGRDRAETKGKNK